MLESPLAEYEVLGFTGTKGPLTVDDGYVLAKSCEQLRPIVVITGACIGVDTWVGNYFADRPNSPMQIVVVPHDRSRVEEWWREYPAKSITVKQMPPGTTYRDRNEEIVRLVQTVATTKLVARGVVAFPKYRERDDNPRSGTWMTVRIAKNRRVPVWDVPLRRKR